MVTVDPVLKEKLGGKAVMQCNFPYLPEKFERKEPEKGVFTCYISEGCRGTAGFLR